MSKFNYRNREHIDVVNNYVSLLNRGFKQRNVTLGQDETLLSLELPDLVQFSIEGNADDKSGSLRIEISWPIHGDRAGNEETSLPNASEALITTEAKKKKKKKKKRQKTRK